VEISLDRDELDVDFGTELHYDKDKSNYEEYYDDKFDLLVEIIIPVGVCAFFWFLFLDWGYINLPKFFCFFHFQVLLIFV
jgi:hypothetical protein